MQCPLTPKCLLRAGHTDPCTVLDPAFAAQLREALAVTAPLAAEISAKEEAAVRRSTIADFKLRVAEFRTRLQALEKELGINLEHEDSQGAFLYFDASDGYPQLWAAEGALYIRETRDAPVQSFYGKDQP